VNSLDSRIDRLIALLEEQEARQLKQSKFSLTRDLITNTILASMMGYFMFRVLDYHFRKTKVSIKD